MMKMRQNGFTLTEILMVVVITAILASITVPRFASQTEKAVAAEAAGILGAIRQGELAYRLDTGAYYSPGNWALLGLDDPSTGTKWNYAVNGTTGTGTATKKIAPNLNTTISLAIDGTWSGDHPNRPT